MKVSVEKLPTSEAVLEVDVTWDEMEKASDKAYKKIVKQVDIQGFRRGKAPRSMIERRLGKEYIYQEGLDELISEAYRDTLVEHEIVPITQPTLDAPSIEMGEPYHFKITVPIVTPVELGDYKSVQMEREEADVTSEEVEQELDTLRQRLTTWKEVEHAAEYDNRVTMDLKVTSGEQKVSDLKDNPFELTHERVGLFSGMDEHIVGMNAGEEKSFTTTIPADYGNEKLAGQEAQFEVKLHKVEEKELPELNDEFAEKVSDGQYTSLEDLRKFLSDNILENKKRRIREELRDKALDAVIEQSSFTLHPLLIDEQAEEMLHQFSHLLEQQKLSLDQYLMMMRKSREEYLKELRPDAEKSVKRQLVLDAIAKAEDITVSPDEIKMLFDLYDQSGQPLQRSKEQADALARSFLREKTTGRLVDIVAGPDPDAAEGTESEESAIAAAAAAEEIAAETDNESSKSEASATETSLPEDTKDQTVE
ncbi:trigger factor [Ktedonobacter sp. SOSP1-52]|uniref:trigger factor n=1 Tax=Ktedonobacter sp. SOSP1-52 TaxID=2778366 RepID=UPI001915B882|nr:trigger factor [Ktedonobacter sp. SOSP1-52]GHO68987.1 trigger factor [Ktedonobacter sp. SOSP1-52]